MNWSIEREEWRIPGSSSTRWPRGFPIQPLEDIATLDPLERLAYQLLFDTIIDCYMIGSGRWQHFCREGWHDKNEAERIWHTACVRATEWVNSDRFAFYLKHFGWDRLRARAVLCELLNGQHLDKIQQLIEKPHNPTGKGGFTKRG